MRDEEKRGVTSPHIADASKMERDKSLKPQPIETLPDDWQPVYVWNPGAGCWQAWYAKRYGFLGITICTHWIPRDVPPPLQQVTAD